MKGYSPGRTLEPHFRETESGRQVRYWLITADRGGAANPSLSEARSQDPMQTSLSERGIIYGIIRATRNEKAAGGNHKETVFKLREQP
jgi:hypothetical protein